MTEFSEETRKEIFRVLVETQDQGEEVETSRNRVAGRFNVTQADIRSIEKEGIAKQWPPL